MTRRRPEEPTAPIPAHRNALPAQVTGQHSKADDLDDLDLFLAEELERPDFKKAYEDAEVRETLLRQLIDARQDARLTQAAVAERMGTTQSAISELECGVGDARLSTLQRYARAVGAKLVACAIKPEDFKRELFDLILESAGPSIRFIFPPIIRTMQNCSFAVQLAGLAAPQGGGIDFFLAGNASPDVDVVSSSAVFVTEQIFGPKPALQRDSVHPIGEADPSNGSGLDILFNAVAV